MFNGIATALTRTGDYAPGHFEFDLNAELNERIRISDNYATNLFVSPHVNAGGGVGCEVLISGTGGNAERAANCVLPFLVSAGSFYNRGVKVQNVLVLQKTLAPAILTESGFIDSTTDTDKMKAIDFVHKIAVAHAKGICQYFGLVYKEMTVVTVNPNQEVINILKGVITKLGG